MIYQKFYPITFYIYARVFKIKIHVCTTVVVALVVTVKTKF